MTMAPVPPASSKIWVLDQHENRPTQLFAYDGNYGANSAGKVLKRAETSFFGNTPTITIGSHSAETLVLGDVPTTIIHRENPTEGVKIVLNEKDARGPLQMMKPHFDDHNHQMTVSLYVGKPQKLMQFTDKFDNEADYKKAKAGEVDLISGIAIVGQARGADGNYTGKPTLLASESGHVLTYLNLEKHINLTKQVREEDTVKGNFYVTQGMQGSPSVDSRDLKEAETKISVTSRALNSLEGMYASNQIAPPASDDIYFPEYEKMIKGTGQENAMWRYAIGGHVEGNVSHAPKAGAALQQPAFDPNSFALTFGAGGMSAPAPQQPTATQPPAPQQPAPVQPAPAPTSAPVSHMTANTPGSTTHARTFNAFADGSDTGLEVSEKEVNSALWKLRANASAADQDVLDALYKKYQHSGPAGQRHFEAADYTQLSAIVSHHNQAIAANAQVAGNEPADTKSVVGKLVDIGYVKANDPTEFVQSDTIKNGMQTQLLALAKASGRASKNVVEDLSDGKLGPTTIAFLDEALGHTKAKALLEKIEKQGPDVLNDPTTKDEFLLETGKAITKAKSRAADEGVRIAYTPHENTHRDVASNSKASNSQPKSGPLTEQQEEELMYGKSTASVAVANTPAAAGSNVAVEEKKKSIQIGNQTITPEQMEKMGQEATDAVEKRHSNLKSVALSAGQNGGSAATTADQNATKDYSNLVGMADLKALTKLSDYNKDLAPKSPIKSKLDHEAVMSDFKVTMTNFTDNTFKQATQAVPGATSVKGGYKEEVAMK